MSKPPGNLKLAGYALLLFNLNFIKANTTPA